MPLKNPPVRILTGPTASGKTAYGHALARLNGMPILSADSMQVYRDLPVATAAPDRHLLQEVCYHFVGQLPPSEAFSAARFLRQSLHIASTLPASHPGLLAVGGTGLYLRALRDGLFEQHAATTQSRELVRQRLAKLGAAALHAELQTVDPESAERIHPNDALRVARALEVYHATGQPISHLWRQPGGLPGMRVQRIVVLDPPRTALYERINRRMAQMVHDGLLREIHALVQRYPLHDLENALRPLGARDLALALASGAISPETPPEHPALAPLLEGMAQTTRQYAKRQWTWFRRYFPPDPPHTTWIDPLAGDFPERLAAIALALDLPAPPAGTTI